MDSRLKSGLEPEEGQPAGFPPQTWERATQASLIVIAVVALVWFLSWARPILLPIAAAIVVGMIFGPIADRAAVYKIPRIATNLGILVGFTAFAYAVAAVFVPGIVAVVAQLPELATEIREKLGFLQGALSRLQNFQNMFGGGDGPAVHVAAKESQVAALFAYVTPAFAQLIVFAFTLIFFLTGRTHIKRQVVLAVRGRENRLKALKMISDIESHLFDYFAIFTLINIGVAIVTAIYLTALGAPSPWLWGFLAWILNYLPVIGPLIMKVLLLGMGILVMPTLTMALLPALGYLLITTVESNFITPRVFGKRLTMEPLLIFLMICLLTWLWGPVGALLSTPILSIVIIAADHLWPSEEVVLPG